MVDELSHTAPRSQGRCAPARRRLGGGRHRSAAGVVVGVGIGQRRRRAAVGEKAWTFSTTSRDDITSQIPSHAITANSSSACRATVITCERGGEVKH